MLKREYSDADKRRIRHAKRGVWTQVGAAQEYQFEAYKPEPLTRMKNLIEIGFATRHVVGPRVLDAGAGTGRFALPLEERGLEVAALDISLQMLGEGRGRARKSGRPFRCVQGDIECLPFGDGVFDSVVTITVLRHFPDWPLLLEECVRVLRPGGRVVLDMASGDQRAYLRKLGVPVPTPLDGESNPLDFDGAMTMNELTTFAAEHRLAVVATGPYGFFDCNALLDHALGDAKAGFDDAIQALLKTDGGIQLYDTVTRYLLPAISPAACPDWLVALERRAEAGPPFAPPYRAARHLPLTGSANEDLMAILSHTLGEDLRDRLRQVETALENQHAQRLFTLCRDLALPRFPLEAFYWDADDTD